MKFLLKKDLTLLLEEHILDQLICEDDRLLDMAEAKAIETCYEWLDSRYDMDFELRGYVDYKFSTVYSDNQRIKVSQSEENDAFGESYNLDLISSGVTSGLTSEFILSKKPNACELPYNTYYESAALNDRINYYELDSRYSAEKNNPDTSFTGKNENYSENCGELIYSATVDGSVITEDDYDVLLSGGNYTGTQITTEVFNFGEKINYYNTEYTGATGTTTVIDYDKTSLVYGYVPSDFYGMLDFFDQYLKENEDRDFDFDDRNSTLVDIVASITIYELIRRTSPRLMNETIADSFDLSMQKLKDCRKGRITLRLKEKPSAENKRLGFGPRFGQNNISIRNKY